MRTNEKGLTLVEVLAASVIMLIVMGIAFPMIMNGQKTAKDIQLQNDMRTFVDIATADLFLKLYNSKESDFQKKPERVATSSETNELNGRQLPVQKKAYFETENGEKTGLVIDEDHADQMLVYSDGEQSPLCHDDFYISSSSYIEQTSNGAYELMLYIGSEKENRAFDLQSMLYVFDDERQMK